MCQRLDSTKYIRWITVSCLYRTPNDDEYLLGRIISRTNQVKQIMKKCVHLVGLSRYKHTPTHLTLQHSIKFYRTNGIVHRLTACLKDWHSFCQELKWTGLDWIKLQWTEMDWTGMKSTGVKWTWLELNLTGLEWTELNWNILYWSGLHWTELNLTSTHQKSAKKRSVSLNKTNCERKNCKAGQPHKNSCTYKLRYQTSLEHF